MLQRKFLVLFPILTFFVVTNGQFKVPAVEVQALVTGLRAAVPAQPGIKAFSFHGTIENMSAGKIPEAIKGEGAKVDDHFVFENKTVQLAVGDTIKYYVFVQNEGLGYRQDDLTFNVARLVPIDTPLIPYKRVQDSGSKKNCEEFSETQVRGIKQCKGRLLFEEHFTGSNLDKTKWLVESRFPSDEQEDEFVSFLPSAVSLKDNNLQIKPTLLSNRPGFNEDSISDGTLDIQPCTISQPKLCNKTANAAYILPPIVSGKVRSQFVFKYGKIEIKAKLPQGDWIYPELYLEPANSEYGQVGFESGIMRVAFARGNSVLQYGSKDISNKALSGGVILGHEDSCRVKGIQENSDYTKKWGDSFHTYRLIWSPSSISLEVDGKPYGSINPPSAGFKEFSCNGMSRRLAEGSPLAPFDKEFYVSIGVGVGGMSDFPNNVGNKPWKNKGSKALYNFWNNMDTWYPTWGEKSALLVDTVKVWAL